MLFLLLFCESSPSTGEAGHSCGRDFCPSTQKGASIECGELTWGEAAQPPPTLWGCTAGQDPAL